MIDSLSCLNSFWNLGLPYSLIAMRSGPSQEEAVAGLRLGKRHSQTHVLALDSLVVHHYLSKASCCILPRQEILAGHWDEATELLGL